jgi:hypothetical protein
MHQVQLADQLYQKAQRRASEAGYSSVDEYITKVVTQDLSDEIENIDHLFTPQRLEHIDKAIEEIKAGKSLTSSQADAELAKRRAEWLRKNPR